MPSVEHRRLYSILATALVMTHAISCLLFEPCLKTSNVFQFLTPVLTALFCFSAARREEDLHLKSLWRLLGSAFCLWAAAQGYFTAFLLITGRVLTYPSVSDALWLAFALPILLIVVRQRSREAGDWIKWLDTGQAGLFFSLLSILVFSRGAGLRITQAYDVQGAALVLLCGLQYSRAHGPDKRFFRDLGAYLFTYALFSSSDYRIEAHGWVPGSVVDLCWTLPSLLFIFLAERTKLRVSYTASRPNQTNSVFSSENLYGTSALGLFLLSLLTGVFLHQRKPHLGYAYIGIASVVFAIRMVCRESQNFRANRSLKESCVRDLLTGLPNRAWLMDPSLNSMQAGSVLLLCNLDRFKTLNESFGRAFADEVLVKIGLRIQQTPHITQVFRIGVDEFLAIVEPKLSVNSQAIAEALLRQVRLPLDVQGRQFSITNTIGGASCVSQSLLAQTLVEADAAVSYGKQHGCNQYVPFAREMLRDAAAEIAFETSLKEAIRGGDITNYYQPIFCTRSHQIVGFEALARWTHAGNIVATPDRFIPVAEDTWMILELGRRLLTQACDDAVLLAEQAGRPIWVSVNLSGKQLLDTTLVKHIHDEVGRSGLAMGSLKVEVTESVLLGDFDRAKQVLDDLRTMGVKIALDDFGTGYSSLSYLAALPFDLLKIDRSFVTALEPGTQRFDITKAIMQLATTLGKTVVAEGIETATEEHHLVSMGCTLLQGFGISRPVPFIKAIALITAEFREPSTVLVPEEQAAQFIA